MSYQYYYTPPYYIKKETKFSLVHSLKIGIYLTLICLVLYILWAYFYYRYSSDRIGNKLLAKFIALHQSDTATTYQNTSSQYLTFDTGVISSDSSLASTNILVKNSVTQEIITQTPFSATVSSSCSPLSNDCVSL